MTASVRKLAAILAADVAGYSRLMGEDQARTLDALRQLRSELFEPVVEEFRGNVVKRMGDGWIVEFASVSDAVDCAMRFQEGLAEHEFIRLRAGIHIGEVVFEEEDVFGDGVNVAARLEELAEPGQVLISDTVYDSLDKKSAQRFGGGEAQDLKNIARTVEVWRWSPNGMQQAKETVGETLPLPDKPSIAVLPFENMSGDPEQEYFADGITEDIITALSKFHWFFVTARNSTFVYKGAAVDIKQAGRELGVRYMLEGSVRKSGDRVRITAQLIEAATGNHIWAERYDRQLQDIFDLQDEITQTISAAVAPELVQSEQERSLQKPTESLDAWDLYLRGVAAIHKLGRENVEEGVDYMTRAIAADPKFAAAYGWLAMAAYSQLAFHWTDDLEETLEQALADANRAIGLNQRSYFAHFALGKLLVQKRDHAAAIRELELAVSLNPSFANGYYGLASAYTFAGEAGKALDNIDLAIRLNPNDPRLWVDLSYRAIALELLDRREEAIAASEQACQYPNAQYLAFVILAALYANAGQMENSAAQLQRARQVEPDFTLEQVEAFVAAGHPDLIASIVGGLRKAGLAEQ